jgi:hypothetical protein
MNVVRVQDDQLLWRAQRHLGGIGRTIGFAGLLVGLAGSDVRIVVAGVGRFA